MTVVCECGNANCAEQIEVPVAEYERARSDSLLYVVVPGHEIPDVEEVVERAGGYAVVQQGRRRRGPRGGRDRPAVLTHSAADGRRALGRGRGRPPLEGRDGRHLAAPRRRRRHARRRRQPRPRRAGQAADPAPLPRRIRGALLRPRRVGARLAGRATCTRCGRSTASSTAPTSWSTRSSPGRKGSSSSSSALAIRRSSAGCRARARSGSAGRGSRVATTIPGTSRRPSSRSRSARVAPRPPNIVNVDEVELETRAPADVGAYLTPDERRPDSPGSAGRQIAAGRRGSVPHCHSAEEEVFVILEGDGDARAWPSPRSERDGARTRRRRSARATSSHGLPGTRRLPLLPRRGRTA